MRSGKILANKAVAVTRSHNAELKLAPLVREIDWNRNLLPETL